MANLREAYDYAERNPNSEFAEKLKQQLASGELDSIAPQYGINTEPFKKLNIKEKEDSALTGLAKGFVKGVGSTVKGVGQIGEKILNAPLPEDKKMKLYTDEEKLAQNPIGQVLTEGNLEAKTPAEKVGKTVEQIAEFAVPSTAIGKLSKLKQARKLTETLAKSFTSSGVATIQEGEIGKGTAIAGATELAFPIAGKLINNLIVKPLGRITKGLGSAVSGGSVDDINNILRDPQTAKEISKSFDSAKNVDILKGEVKQIMDGVSRIRKEASSLYNKGLESLSSTDINQNIIKDEVVNAIKSHKGIVSNKGFSLNKSEFASDKKLVKEAGELIKEINGKKELSGRDVKQLMDKVQGTRLKTATSDVNISFNKFIDDLSSSLRNSINRSTNKLSEINKTYSQDIQLVDAIQDIYGKVEFKNIKEINRVAKKIEGIASQKGLSSEVVDNFFNRIYGDSGKSSQAFKTTESVRKMLSKEGVGNRIGSSVSEIVQTLSAGIITPKLITDIAIATGKSEPVIKKLIENIAPAMRATVIKGLIVPTKE